MTTTPEKISSSSLNLNGLLPLHPFHIVALSPWPILTSASIFGMLAAAALWFNNLNGSGFALCLGITAVSFMLANWFKDVSVESALLGLHTKVVAQAHVIGIGLFITTKLPEAHVIIVTESMFAVTSYRVHNFA